MMTNICERLGNQLAKTAGKFDHSTIKRIEVHINEASLKKDLENLRLERDFCRVIHEAYMEYRAEGKDANEEETLRHQDVLQDENHYQGGEKHL